MTSFTIFGNCNETLVYSMSRILVCDGEQRAALAVLRSLGRAGHQVDVTSHDSRAISGASRYRDHFATVPNPIDHADGFVAATHRLARLWNSEIIIPVTDQSSAALLPARQQFGKSIIPGPSAASFNRVSDKQDALEQAALLGIATPRQVVVGHPAAGPLDDCDLPFPVVIKPSKALQRGGRWQARYASDAKSLRAAVAEAPADAFPLLIQQRIIGWGCGIFFLIWEGRTVATFAHRRLRELPPSGGGSVYSESIRAEP